VSTFSGEDQSPEERQREYRHMVENILRDDWKEKRPYSSVLHIGNPEWVKQKSAQLKEARREKWRDWKERFRLKFHSASP